MSDRTAERQRGLDMAGPFAHLLDAVALDMHNNESLHLHDVTERFEECGYCYLRAGRALGHVARALKPLTLVPRELAEVLAESFPRLCNVCTGLSPSNDGHDMNPPCAGYAREALRKALRA